MSIMLNNVSVSARPPLVHIQFHHSPAGFSTITGSFSYQRDSCSGLLTPDTYLGENARHREVPDDQATPYLYP